MATLGEKLAGLEKRLMRLEIVLGINPKTEDLLHPKAFRQMDKMRTEQDAFSNLQDKLHQYIYAHYDQGTQTSFILIYMDSSTPQVVKGAISLAWVWMKAVLAYYYQIKGQIELNNVWVEPDFNQFDEIDPKISLKGFLGKKEEK